MYFNKRYQLFSNYISLRNDYEFSDRIKRMIITSPRNNTSNNVHVYMCAVQEYFCLEFIPDVILFQGTAAGTITPKPPSPGPKVVKRFVPTYKGAASVFCIQLFCIDERYEMR